MNSVRDCFVSFAKQSVVVKNYEGMVKVMTSVVKMGVELTSEERKLLAFGYRGVISSRLNTWRISRIVEEESISKGWSIEEFIMHRLRVENEMTETCTEILSILDECLIPSISTPDASVYYYTLKGDIYRYLSVFKTGRDRKEAADEALEAYKTATLTAAVAELPRADPIRLGLDLNHALFYEEILHLPERACQIVNEAIDEASLELCKLSEEACSESSKTLQILKNNVRLWTGRSKLDDEAIDDMKLLKDKITLWNPQKYALGLW